MATNENEYINTALKQDLPRFMSWQPSSLTLCLTLSFRSSEYMLVLDNCLLIRYAYCFQVEHPLRDLGEDERIEARQTYENLDIAKSYQSGCTG